MYSQSISAEAGELTFRSSRITIIIKYKVTVFIIQAGKLEPSIKSEEPPKDNSGPVTIVTASTFDEIVFSGKNVLIEFYAPWCGHCKKLAPAYEEASRSSYLLLEIAGHKLQKFCSAA